MPRIIDLTGQQFGRLTVIQRSGTSQSRQAQWLCQCACGNTTLVQAYDLKSGNTQSCGCQRKENFTHTIHGHSGERLHGIWKGMKSRCYNRNRANYKDYGGKGVVVCDEWKNNFEAFYVWAVTHGYSDELSIDRIDPEGNYEPSNCRWADSTIQGSNRTNVAVIECNGEKHTVTEWAKITGIKYATIYNRIFIHNWPIEKALEREVNGKAP